MNFCIIGGGSIGALKPDNIDYKGSEILTHAHALYYFKKFNKINYFCIVEKNSRKRLLIKKKWECDVFKSIKNIKKNIDVFIIAVNTEFQNDVIKEIINLKKFPKIFIIEKPFCENYEQANEIYNYFEKINKIPIVINYSRRFIPEIQKLKERLQNNLLGKIQAVNISYCRGLKRDGCHAIDLCNYLFGDFIDGKIIGHKHNAFSDYSEDDLTFPVWLEYSKCKNIFMLPLNGENYSIFDFCIYTKDYKIEILQHGDIIRFFKKSNTIYGDFNSMKADIENIIVTRLKNNLIFLYNNILDYLENNNIELKCTSLDGLKTQKILKYLFKA